MTTAQEKKYWRRWNAVSGWLGWFMRAGRLVHGPESTVHGPQSEHHARVWQIAQTLAAAGARAVVPEDLRHACHIYAIGRDRSHKDFSNAQFSRVLVLWGNELPRGASGALRGLLLDPEDLASIVAWDNSEVAQRRALVEGIRRSAPFAMIDTIARRNCREHYQAPFYEDLPLPELRGVLAALRSMKERELEAVNDGAMPRRQTERKHEQH